MSHLEDYRFELDGYQFGLGCPVASESFDPGVSEWRTQRADQPREGGRIFGKDVPSAATWAWSLFTDGVDDTTALALRSQFKKIWRADSVRSRVGAVVGLKYTLGNRTRMVYGRPGRFAAPLDNKMLGGRIDITADFECVDDMTYGVEWKSSGIFGLLGESGVGLEAPLEAPLTQVGVTTSLQTTINVGGEEPTWAVIKFYGPSNGSAHNVVLTVDSGAWEARLVGPLVSGEIATLDPRPWVRTVLREDGGSYAGQMPSKMWLMKLTPGEHTLVLTAQDASGTVRCAVSWQEASSSL